MTESSEQVSFTPVATTSETSSDTTSVATESKPKAVFIENLSPSITSKTLNDFFSLCGTIESITLRPKPKAEDGTLEAIVFFESSSAADTAVLLTNAILVDRTISITYYKGSTDSEDGKDKEGGKDSSEGSAPSVWASLLAASYKFSDDVQARAAEFDTKYGVTKGFEDTVGKIDQTLGLTEKFNAMTAAVQQKSEELGVKQKMDALNAGLVSAGQSLERGANAVLDSAMQNAYVSSAWTTLSGWGSSLVSGWTQLTQEANQIYPRNQTTAAAPAAVPESTAQPTSDPVVTTDSETVVVPTSEAPQEEPKPAESVHEPSSEEPKEPPAN